MADPKDIDATMEDDYDEEADSDFDAGEPDDIVSSSADEDDEQGEGAGDSRPRKRRKLGKTSKRQEDLRDLDSGDEATIQELEKSKRKQQQGGQILDEDNIDGKDQGWRARTRAMREREKDEKRKNKLATIKGSTIDVDKLWEDMNKPGDPELPPPSGLQGRQRSNDEPKPTSVSSTLKETLGPQVGLPVQNEQTESDGVIEDTITIRRTYKFAGEVHVEEKIVPKSSAEARLWLSQQSSKDMPAASSSAKPARRPLRKISRFDPNLNNLDSIRKSWERLGIADGSIKGPKLNTVEKSKMDWAAHVDQEGLKDELDEHAKAKEGYLGRMDFLGQVEQRREEEARIARTKG